MDPAALIQSIRFGVVVAVDDTDRASLEPGADQDDVSAFGFGQRIWGGRSFAAIRLVVPRASRASRSACVRVHAVAPVEIVPAIALVCPRADLEELEFGGQERGFRHVLEGYRNVLISYARHSRNVCLALSMAAM